MNPLDYSDIYTYSQRGYPPGEGFHPLPLFKDLPTDAPDIWRDRYETAERIFQQHCSLEHPFYSGDEVQWFGCPNEPETLLIRWEISKCNEEGLPPYGDPDEDYACLYVQFEPNSNRLYNATIEAERLGEELWSIDNAQFHQEEMLYAAREIRVLTSVSNDGLTNIEPIVSDIRRRL